VGIFPNCQMRMEDNVFLVLDIRVRGQGNVDMVAHTADVNNDMRRIFMHQSSFEKSDHDKNVSRPVGRLSVATATYRRSFCSWSCASTTAMAAIFTISRIELPS